jgi:hypothetical protein
VKCALPENGAYAQITGSRGREQHIELTPPTVVLREKRNLAQAQVRQMLLTASSARKAVQPSLTRLLWPARSAVRGGAPGAPPQA